MRACFRGRRVQSLRRRNGEVLPWSQSTDTGPPSAQRLAQSVRANHPAFATCAGSRRREGHRLRELGRFAEGRETDQEPRPRRTAPFACRRRPSFCHSACQANGWVCTSRRESTAPRLMNQRLKCYYVFRNERRRLAVEVAKYRGARREAQEHTGGASWKNRYGCPFAPPQV